MSNEPLFNDGLDDIFGAPAQATGAGSNSTPLNGDPEEIFRPLSGNVPSQAPAAGGLTIPMQGAVTYTISVANDTVWDAVRVHSLMEKIITNIPQVTFQIVADAKTILWQIVDVGRQETDATRISSIIRSVLPEAVITATPYTVPSLTQPFTRLIAPLRQDRPFFAPIKSPVELKDNDPLITVANLFNQLQDGERASYMVYVGCHDPQAKNQALQEMSRRNFDAGEVGGGLAKIGKSPFVESGWVGLALAGILQIFFAVLKTFIGGRVAKFDPAMQELFWNKINNPLFRSYIFVQIDVLNAERLAAFEAIFHTLTEFAGEYQCPILNEAQVVIGSITNAEDAATESAFELVARLANGSIVRDEPRFRTVFNPHELASLWHIPNNRFEASRISWAKTSVAMPEVMKSQRAGVQFGTNRHTGRDEPVYLPDENRVSHMYTVGRTSVGKSTFLHNLIHQDIMQGKGVTVIDPHGSLVENILRWSIPADREKDVVLLELANHAYPIPLNLLATPAGIPHETAATQVMAVMEKYGNLGDTVTITPTLWASLMLLSYAETPTLRDVSRVLGDDTYRQDLLNQAEENPVVMDFWEMFERKSPSQQALLAAPIIQRMSSFYGSPTLYRMTCHPDRMDWAALINANKIILLSLSDKRNIWPEHHKELLGGTSVSQIQMAAMTRGVGAKPYFLYIDEAERLVTAALDKTLNEARKYGLALTLANQFLGQLKGNVLKAVMGNVGAFICFQVGHEDATALTHYLRGFDAETLTNLDAYSAAVAVRYGVQTHAFSLTTLPSLERIEELDEACRRERRIREHSIKTYTPKTSEEVNHWLKARYGKPNRTTGAGTDGSVDDFLE